MLLVAQKLQWQLTHKTCNMLHEKLQTHNIGHYNVNNYKLEVDIL
jgi:hypothetical protein